MQPRRYSELFFLDEATAFAAGHRPCGECRRERHDAFKTAWFAANHPAGKSISEIDAALHLERVTAERGKRTFRAPLADLPPGTIARARGGSTPPVAKRMAPVDPEGLRDAERRARRPSWRS